MKEIILIIFIVLAGIYHTSGQEIQYIKNNVGAVNELDSSDFILVTGALDTISNLYPVTEYYKNGSVKSRGTRSKNTMNYEGKKITYFASGQKRELLQYKNGQLIGNSYAFFPNGKLYTEMEFVKEEPENNGDNCLIKTVNDSTGKAMVVNGNGYFIQYDDDFKSINIEGNIVKYKWDGERKGYSKVTESSYTELYKKGKLVSGISIDKYGKAYPYRKDFTAASFRGSDYSFSTYIFSRLEPLRSKIYQKVFIKFVIDTNGKVVSPEIMRGSAVKEINDEILMVFNLMPNWIPSMEKGIPVTRIYHLPLSFHTGNPLMPPVPVSGLDYIHN